MSNATHIPGLSTNLSHHHAIQGSMVAQGHGLGTAPTQHEAYAVGKVIRRAFDSLWQTLQKVWGQELSIQELAARKRFTLYRQGLRECVQQLGRALEQVLKNPYASGSIEKIHALMSHYNIYLQPSKDLQWQDYQQKAFKPLSEMVSQEADPRIRHAFRELLPILFQKEAENPDELKAKRSLQQSGGFPAVFDLATLNGTNGFTIPGIAVGGYLGTSLASGDINGDGIADLVLGANSVSSLLGEVYVVFGRVSGWPASFNIASLNGTNGFAIPGVAANGILGTTVSTADINGDGKTDLVLGADGVSSYTGVAYVIFGKANGWSASFDLTTLNGLNGFGIPGIAAGGNFGYSVSTAGDINKDGKDDLIIGGRLVAASSQGGAAYVIFGQAGGWPASFNLGGLNGVNGFGIPGIAANGNLGQSVSTAGDINGDGIGDLAIGAPTVGTSNGAVYVVFGRSSSWSSSFNLALLNGTNGFVVSGISASDNLFWVRAAGDINSDGKADLALGAQGASSGAGASYVIFGQASGWSSSFNLAALNGANGFAIPGAWIVDTAGDVNGDGLSDLVLGSYSGSGIAYVIFGKQAVGQPQLVSEH